MIPPTMDFFEAALLCKIIFSDTSDFSEGEIRCLYAENPVSYSELFEGKWDGKLKKNEPIDGDYGINKEREVFWYVGNEWKSIK